MLEKMGSKVCSGVCGICMMCVEGMISVVCVLYIHVICVWHMKDLFKIEKTH